MWSLELAAGPCLISFDAKHPPETLQCCAFSVVAQARCLSVQGFPRQDAAEIRADRQQAAGKLFCTACHPADRGITASLACSAACLARWQCEVTNSVRKNLSPNWVPCSPAWCSAVEPLGHELFAMLQLLTQAHRAPYHHLPLQS